MAQRIIFDRTLLKGGMTAQYHIICELKKLANRPVYFDLEKGQVDIEAEQQGQHLSVFGHKHPELPKLEVELPIELLCKHIAQIPGITGVLVHGTAISVSVGIGYYWEEDGIHQSIIDAVTSYLSLTDPQVRTVAEWQKANGFEPLDNTPTVDTIGSISTMIIGDPGLPQGFGRN